MLGFGILACCKKININMKSIALVIGENNYLQQQSLSETEKDAKDISEALGRLGYDVQTYVDCNQHDMSTAIADFQDQAEKYEVALLYFSGHGIMVNGENFLCPIDVDASSIKRIIGTSKKLEDVMKDMPENLKVKIFIIDACRTDVNDLKGAGAGICPTNAPKGSLVAFATSPGTGADAGGPNGNSMYTYCLLKYIETKGIAIEECFKRVRTELYRISNEEQWSWEHTSLIGDYYFNNVSTQKRLIMQTYSNNSLADMNYVTDSSNAGKAITGFRSHDWYKQKDAFSLFQTLRPGSVDTDTLFVLGRNLLQAACGDSNLVVEYFRNLGVNLLKWTGTDGKNHVLNGMLFETYFNREGNFRGIGKIKVGMIDALMSLSSDPKYADAFEFISSELEPYASCLYFIPKLKEGKYEIMVSMEEEEGQYFKHVIIKSIKINGAEIYNPEETSSSFPYKWDKVTEALRHYMAIPSDKIDFVKDLESEGLNNIELPYPLRLSVPQ